MPLKGCQKAYTILVAHKDKLTNSSTFISMESAHLQKIILTSQVLLLATYPLPMFRTDILPYQIK